jgi:hypothetical protein
MPDCRTLHIFTYECDVQKLGHRGYDKWGQTRSCRTRSDIQTTEHNTLHTAKIRVLKIPVQKINISLSETVGQMWNYVSVFPVALARFLLFVRFSANDRPVRLDTWTQNVVSDSVCVVCTRMEMMQIASAGWPTEPICCVLFSLSFSVSLSRTLHPNDFYTTDKTRGESYCSLLFTEATTNA